MTAAVFKLCYVIGLVAASIIRKVYTKPYLQKRTEVKRTEESDRVLMFLPFLGMFLLPVLYLLTPWLDFADYPLPGWVGWLGALLFAAAVWLLWRSHVDLGLNFSPELEIFEGHSLVTEGVYQRIRHPMYAAHWLWGIAQILLLQNWIAGLSMLVTLLPLYLVRVPREERMLLEHFGEAYQEYTRCTGRIMPRILRGEEESRPGTAETPHR
jgi:protein-S-isoprenylcysteine O-methyltransferase Ste14